MPQSGIQPLVRRTLYTADSSAIQKKTNWIKTKLKHEQQQQQHQKKLTSLIKSKVKRDKRQDIMHKCFKMVWCKTRRRRCNLLDAVARERRQRENNKKTTTRRSNIN